MTMKGTQTHNVFVYGSLLADQVVGRLLTRLPASSPATLPNFHRFSIKGRIYPAILPVENKSVLGRVLLGVTDSELKVLDIFEDVEYVRDSVEVSLVENSDKLQVYAYVWKDKNDRSLYGNWDFEEWKLENMEEFIKMTEEFVVELGASETKSRIEICESYYQSTEDDKSSAV